MVDGAVLLCMQKVTREACYRSEMGDVSEEIGGVGPDGGAREKCAREIEAQVARWNLEFYWFGRHSASRWRTAPTVDVLVLAVYVWGLGPNSTGGNAGRQRDT